MPWESPFCRRRNWSQELKTLPAVTAGEPRHGFDPRIVFRQLWGVNRSYTLRWNEKCSGQVSSSFLLKKRPFLPRIIIFPIALQKKIFFITLDFSNYFYWERARMQSPGPWAAAVVHARVPVCLGGRLCRPLRPALHQRVEGSRLTLEFGDSVVVFSVCHLPVWCPMGLIILRKCQSVKVWVLGFFLGFFFFEVLTYAFVRQMSLLIKREVSANI